MPLLPDVPQLIPDLWMLVHEQAASLQRVQLVKDALIDVLTHIRNDAQIGRAIPQHEE